MQWTPCRWVHLVIVHDDVGVPGTARSHEEIPVAARLVCCDELAQGVYRWEPASWSAATLEDERRDGDVHAVAEMEGLVGGEYAGIDEEGLPGGGEAMEERAGGHGRRGRRRGRGDGGEVDGRMSRRTTG